jgi:hypothetical protein
LNDKEEAYATGEQNQTKRGRINIKMYVLGNDWWGEKCIG